MADLSTTYMGKEIKNPLVVGSCDMSTNIDKIKEIEKAGAGAIVIKSLFEEQIQLERAKLEEERTQDDNYYAEMTSLFPDIEHSGPKEHLFWLEKAKKSVNIPVMASLNAVNKPTWVEYAKLIEQTGVDGIELNLYTSSFDFNKSSAEVEKDQIDIIGDIRKAVSIPIAVKLSSFYTSPLNFIKKLDETGVNGFVLFNQLFQPDIDVNQEKNTFPFNYSEGNQYKLPLRFAGLLHKQIKAEICASTGIFESSHVVKMLLAGANYVQIVSALYRNGISQISAILKGLEKWMDEKGYSSLNDFRGKMSGQEGGDAFTYYRSQYIKLLLRPNATS